MLGAKSTIFFVCVCESEMCNKGENHTNYREFIFSRRNFKMTQRKLLVLEKEKQYMGENNTEIEEEKDYFYEDYLESSVRGKEPSIVIWLSFLKLVVNNA